MKLAAILLACSLAGCSVPTSSSLGSGPTNTCSKDSDCGDGSCYDRGDTKVCIAPAYSIQGMYLEVHPGTQSSYAPDLSFLVAAQSLDLAQGLPTEFDVQLGSLTKVTGTIQALKDYSKCASPGATLSGSVLFTPSYPLLGIAARAVAGKQSPVSDVDDLVMTAPLVPGTYDISVSAAPPEGCTGSIASDLLRQYQISDSSFTFQEPKPYRLQGTLKYPLDAQIEGWLMEVVDPTEGAVISTTVPLPAPEPFLYTVPFSLDFHLKTGQPPVLRLRPPPGVVAPWVYWDLTGAQLDTSKDVVTIAVDAEDLLTKPTEVGGTITSDAGKTPATLVIQSKSLTGVVADNASYAVTYDSPDGNFDVELPPGLYSVIAVPSSPELGVSAPVEWQIDKGEGCSCGHGVFLDPAEQLTVHVSAEPSGRDLDGVAVEVDPSFVESSSYLHTRTSVSAALPRQAIGATDGTGTAELVVDPGAVDVSARPPDGSSLPWAVRYKTKAGAPIDLSLDVPGILTGTILDPDGNALPETRITAWLPVDGKIAVAIGETTTDARGSYWLPLPRAVSP